MTPKLRKNPPETIVVRSRGISGTISRGDLARVRESVLKRDGYRCVLCGRMKNLAIHEIVYRSRHQKNSVHVFQVRRMITLCVGCHTSWHEDGAFRKKSLRRVKYYLKGRR